MAKHIPNLWNTQKMLAYDCGCADDRILGIWLSAHFRIPSCLKFSLPNDHISIEIPGNPRSWASHLVTWSATRWRTTVSQRWTPTHAHRKRQRSWRCRDYMTANKGTVSNRFLQNCAKPNKFTSRFPCIMNLGHKEAPQCGSQTITSLDWYCVIYISLGLHGNSRTSRQ